MTQRVTPDMSVSKFYRSCFIFLVLGLEQLGLPDDAGSDSSSTHNSSSSNENNVSLSFCCHLNHEMKYDRVNP